MIALSDNKQCDIIDTFKTTSRYLDILKKIDNICFYDTVNQMNPSEIQRMCNGLAVFWPTMDLAEI